MQNEIFEYKAAATAFFGFLTALWGWLGWLVVSWVTCMLLDYITGSAAAGKAGEWSSRRAVDGIWHKMGMMVVVIVAAIADLMINLLLTNLPVLALPVDYSGLICPVVLVWYMLTELGSITENAIKMGAPVPSWLQRLLAASRDAVDKTGNSFVRDECDDS